MAKVYTGERVFLSPLFAGPERFLYRLLRVDPEREQDWKAYAKSLIDLLARRLAAAVPDPAHAERLLRAPRAEPARLPLGAVERHVQHHLVVPDEHQLAVLRRRDDDELPQPDDRADGAELALGRRRHRRGGRAGPRDHRAQRQEPRQLLAGPRAHDPVRARADLGDRRARARLPGRDPELLHLPDGAHDHGPDAVDRDGPGRLAGGDQGARHQRRRLLQRQLGAPVREPDGVHQLLRDAARADHPGGARLHVRAHDRQPPPGLRDLRRDDGHVPRRGRSSPTSPRRTARPPSTPPACTRTSIPGSTGGNMEGKEQRFGIAGSALFDVVTTVTSCGAVNSAIESFTGHRRRRAVGQPVRQRGDLRRRRHGPVLDPAVRPAGGVHRRPDGRAHARVARQEARGAGRSSSPASAS